MNDINLDVLLKDLPGLTGEFESGGLPQAQVKITGVSTDPDLCRPGFLYVAEEGETVDSKRYGVRLDGREFIPQALKNGAVAVLTTPGVSLPLDHIEPSGPGAGFSSSSADSSRYMVWHPRPLSILGAISSRFFGEPRPKHIALVTGTNGKTSTVNFCRMLWSKANLPSCSIGNLGGVCSDGTVVWDRDPTLSVPETVTLHHLLHTIAGNGFDHVAMEATSHALFDFRLNGLPATIGAFTNLTRDHLDFHQTMEEYFRVKMTLFQEVLEPGSWAVLNADAEWFVPALEICKARGHQIISFGFNGSEIRLMECVKKIDGQDLVLEIFGQKYQCHLSLLGLFQVSNVLCALGIVIAAGLSPEQAVEFVASLTEVEGRLNTVAVTPAGGRVIVDYAHSPDGIRAALEACRTFTEGQLYVVFGCNGERDSGKRAQMGAVAASLADQVIVTDGHPRTEDPARIRQDVMVGAPGALEVANRVAAIELAVKALTEGDTVLIAGMGHENFQTIGTRRLPHSDSETVQRIVASLVEAMAVQN